MLTVDIETYDPNLHTLGDGSVRMDGFIICCGVWDSKRNSGRVYDFMNEHDREECIALLESCEDKCFHNGLYDMSWLSIGYSISVGGTIHDTMTRAALIDEYMDLDLDSCCKKFRVTGKNKGDTIEAWYDANRKLLGLSGPLWQNVEELMLWPEFKQRLFKYNLQDCRATNDLFWAQEQYMGPYTEPYDVECRLYPLLIEMKRHGVRIDESALAGLRETVQRDLDKVVNELDREYGITPEMIRSTKQIGEYFNNLGVHSPLKTPKGAEAWNLDAFDRLVNKHAAVPLIQAYKAKATLLDKYLNGALSECIWNGRVHCTFSPNKRDDGGTITGRFACKTPNLQNISAREEKHGQKTYGSEMRSLFIPEEGCWMSAFDYSQIEFLLFVANAYGPQAEWLKGQARAGVDFHNMAMGITGLKERFPVKCINYGTIYGMGLEKLKMQNYIKFMELAEKAGIPMDAYIGNIYNTYHEKLPVIKDTMKHIEQVCRIQGYVTGIGGRRHHKPKPFMLDGRINDGIYKITNYKLQGDAAEMIKKAMLTAWDDGVFVYIMLHLQVHDELVSSVPKNKEGVQALWHLHECMVNAYKERLDVPVNADGGLGTDWNTGKHDEEFLKRTLVEYGIKEVA